MKNKLNVKLKEKPIIAAVLCAIIIGLICLIIYFLNYYSPKFKTIPNMEISSTVSSSIKLEPIKYDYIYKGESFSLDTNFDVNNYDYSNCTIYKEYSTLNPIMQVEGNYKITDAFVNTYMYNPETHQYEKYETSKVYIDKNKMYVYLSTATGMEHTFVSVYSVVYGDQGQADYVVKVIEQGNYNLGILREYNGITVEDTEKIEEIIGKLNYSNFFEKLEIVENKINLTYKYDLPEESKNIISLAIFLILDDIEEITFYHTNTKFVKTEYDSEAQKTNYTYYESADATTIKKEELQEKNDLNFENLKNSIGIL